MRFVAVDRDWPTHPGFRHLSAEAERLFWRLMVTGDPHGCHRAEPVHLMSMLDTVVASKTIQKWLDELMSAGLVVAWEHDDRHWVEILEYDEHQTERMLAGRPDRVAPPRPAGTFVLPQETIDRNVVADLVPPVVDTFAEKVREVFVHWAAKEEATGGIKGAKLTDGRRKRIVARLKDGYSVDDLKACVDGYLATPFYVGKEPGKGTTRYSGLDTIFLNGERVEKGKAIAAQLAKASETSDRFSAYDKVGV